ncbi:MAG: NB-ARC domain-containing protein [Candidatus Heimdallarchaeaceae archaeon]
MSIEQLKTNRQYGYEILINNFEPFLREFIINELLLLNYGNEWIDFIPKGIFNYLSSRVEDVLPEDIQINLFFEELNLLHLKDIILFKTNFVNSANLVGNLSKNTFRDKMDTLNRYRRKIAHAKSTFSKLDLLNLIDCIHLICQGNYGKNFQRYLDKKEYQQTKTFEIPETFFEEYECPNNLPPENYDLDGGFVGREKEINGVVKTIKSDLDRIVTITGAGGVGKTALALKIAYMFLTDYNKPFDAVIWFSAKTSKLTEDGIVPLKPDIRSLVQLVNDMLKILDPNKVEKFVKNKKNFSKYKDHLYNILSTQKCLIVIDNLETIIEDEELISFIKDIPRPSQVLITSRKGLGEIERRYPLGDMLEKDAIHLFRLVAMERNKQELVDLDTKNILKLVRSVRCYPLLIKWSLGQYCLGKDLEKAFSEIMTGDSEIVKFSFNDVFELLSEKSKLVLYSMIIVGEKPISQYAIRTLANITEDELDDAIRELTITSFIYPVLREVESRIVTDYNMLELTRGFLQSKLDEDKPTLDMLDARLHDLSDQIKDLEVSQSRYSQSLMTFGIKTIDEKVAFNYVKTAKTYQARNDLINSEKYYKLALEAAPNLSYVLTEYSKFEFSRKHYHEALNLAKKAVDVNPRNFHSWFNYGIILKKTRKYNEAIKALKNAKKLNSNYLPIYTELGRVYTFNGEFEKAEKEFENALKEEKYPNYRHLLIVRQYMAENFRRWAEEFGKRRDYERKIEKLMEAKEVIDKAVTQSKGDWKIWKIYRQIYTDLGIAICGRNGYYEGKKYLEEALKPVTISRITLNPSGVEAARAYFYLAVYAKKESKLKDKSIIDSYIKKGLQNCPQNCKWYKKLEDLLLETEVKDIRNQSRLYGYIKYYSNERNFGVIQSDNDSYIFFKSDLKIDVKKNWINLNNKYVSFVLRKNKDEASKRNPFIATEINFENNYI